MKKRQVYLDYAATTPTDPRVIKTMLPYFGQYFGNTMSLHQQGVKASEAVERVRGIVADFIGAKMSEIVFTGSATESNNLVIKGVTAANKNKNQIMISAIEHDCVLESAKWLATQGWKVDFVPVNKEGIVDIDFIKNKISKETLLVSVIHGNNEVGVIQNIAQIGELCRSNGVLFHTDASQSLGKVAIDVEAMKIDLLTASSHKIYGPKGAAILYVREGVAIEPLLHGGGHENGLRSSTVNVAAIVGMGKALEIYKKVGEKENKKVKELRDYLVENVLKRISRARVNGSQKNRLVNNANISFDFIEGEGLLLELDRYGIEVSTGSACSSASLEPSHVLMAMGLKPQEAHGAIRFSLGRWTTKKDIDYVLQILPKIVNKLRRISPYKK